MIEAQARTAEVRGFIDEIYNSTGGQGEDIKSFTDVEITVLAKNLSKGVPIATPVFDGAAEERDQAPAEAGRPAGDRPDVAVRRPHRRALRSPSTTVGYMYMLKLNHLVDDKMHAVPPGRTPWLRSSRWAVRRSSAVSASAKWKSGRWKLTAPRYTLQEMLTLSRMISPAGR